MFFKKSYKVIFLDFIVPFFILFVVVYALYNSIGFSGSDSVSKSLMDRYSDTSFSK